MQRRVRTKKKIFARPKRNTDLRERSFETNLVWSKGTTTQQKYTPSESALLSALLQPKTQVIFSARKVPLAEPSPPTIRRIRATSSNMLEEEFCDFGNVGKNGDDSGMMKAKRETEVFFTHRQPRSTSRIRTGGEQSQTDPIGQQIRTRNSKWSNNQIASLGAIDDQIKFWDTSAAKEAC